MTANPADVAARLTEAQRETCGACRFWVAGEYGGGSCYRMPPVPYFHAAFDGLGSADAGNLRPYTEPHEWCGEFVRAILERTDNDR